MTSAELSTPIEDVSDRKKLDVPAPEAIKAPALEAPQPAPIKSGLFREPANDDALLAGQILRALQHTPSPWPYFLAIVAIGAYGAGLFLIDGFDPMRIAQEENAVFKAALMACPPLAFLLIAAFARQLQRVRYSADAMARIAVRLVTPAATAEGEVLSLSQTVRMEVSALGDGIERSLSRIGDMEIVASDLLRRLEEAYSKADLKMHSLTRRLASERESLEAYAERVGETILSAKNRIDFDVTQAAERISSEIRTISDAFLVEVETKANNTVETLNKDLENRVAEYGNLLQAYAANTSRMAGEANNGVRAAGEKIAAEAAANMVTLRDLFAAAQREFAFAQSKSISMMESHSESLLEAVRKSEETLNETSNGLVERLRDFDENSVKRVSDLASEACVAAQSMRGAADALESQVDRVSNTVETVIGGATERFESHVMRNAIIVQNSVNNAMDVITTSLIESVRNFRASVEDARPGEELQAAIVNLQESFREGIQQFREEYNQFCTDASQIFEQNTVNVADSVINASAAANERMLEAGTRLCASVEDTGNILLRDLDALNSQVLETLRTASESATQSVTEAADTPLEMIRIENERYKEEAKTTLKNLSELNGVIRSTISGMEKRIGAVTKSLVMQAEIYLDLVEGKRPGSERVAAAAPSEALAGLMPVANLSAIRPAPQVQAPKVDNVGLGVLAEIAAQVPDVPERDSPTWVSSLLARASVRDQEPPRSISDLVHEGRLETSLSQFASGHHPISLQIYTPAGLSVFEHMRSRYAADLDFRINADRIAASFMSALQERIADNPSFEWSAFIEERFAGLMTAHAIGALPARA